MKIYLDNIIYSLQPLGGISVVWTNLLEHLLKTGHDLRFLEYDGCEENVSRKTILIPESLIDHRSGKLMQLRRYFNPSVCCDEKFLFHSSYFRYSTNPNAINISTVHDFTYEYFQPTLKRWIHCRQKYAALRHSRVIVCISESTKRDLLKFLPDIPEERVRVIYNGVDEVYRPLGKSHEDFFLYVGDRSSKYKNYAAAVEISRRMGKKLVVVGRPLEEHEKFDNVVLKSRATNIELNELYNTAYCLLYPSLYEGFGLPVIEAQKTGCPVLALNTSSIPEIIGNTPLLVDSLNIDNICEKLKILENEEARKQIAEEGLKNAERFSWGKTAEEYLKLYNEIYY